MTQLLYFRRVSSPKHSSRFVYLKLLFFYLLRQQHIEWLKPFLLCVSETSIFIFTIAFLVLELFFILNVVFISFLFRPSISVQLVTENETMWVFLL